MAQWQQSRRAPTPAARRQAKAKRRLSTRPPPAPETRHRPSAAVDCPEISTGQKKPALGGCQSGRAEVRTPSGLRGRTREVAVAAQRIAGTFGCRLPQGRPSGFAPEAVQRVQFAGDAQRSARRVSNVQASAVIPVTRLMIPVACSAIQRAGLRDQRCLPTRGRPYSYAQGPTKVTPVTAILR